MSDYTTAVKYAMFFFMALMLIEWIASKISNKKVYQISDTISSISSGMTNNIKSILNLSVVIISYHWMFESFAIFQISSSWWVYVLGFLGIDFANYWTHRWNHEYNILWNRHIIHHSSEEYNLACALRQTISTVFQIYFFLYLPLAIIGIPPKVIAILLPLHLFAQFWYHTKLINKMGILEKIIVTPSHHRVHHAINDIYLDKNYAAIFIFWDYLFGTFQEELESEPPVYGIKKPAKTWNPIIINFMHLYQLFKDAIRTKKWKDKFKIWFMPTGWRPNDVKEIYPIETIENPHNYIKYSNPKNIFLNFWSCFQLLIHLGMQFHVIYLLSSLGNTEFDLFQLFTGYQVLITYGIFFVISVWSFTSLMDRSLHFLVVETFKNIVGFGLIILFPEVLNIYKEIDIPILIPSLYLFFSQIISIYYFIKFLKERKVSLIL